MPEIDQLKDVMRIFADLIANRFYGELVVKFESGKIVLIRETRNLKIKI